MVKNLPAMQETWVWSLGWEDPLEKEVTPHARIIAGRIPWTEESGRLQVHGVAKTSEQLSFTSPSLCSGVKLREVFLELSSFCKLFRSTADLRMLWCVSVLSLLRQRSTKHVWYCSKQVFRENDISLRKVWLHRAYFISIQVFASFTSCFLLIPYFCDHFDSWSTNSWSL